MQENESSLVYLTLERIRREVAGLRNRIGIVLVLSMARQGSVICETELLPKLQFSCDSTTQMRSFNLFISE